MDIRFMKYLFFPIAVKDKSNIHIRKRILHKGYALLKVTKENDINSIGAGVIHYEHIVYTDTIEQTETYLKNEYGIEVTL